MVTPSKRCASKSHFHIRLCATSRSFDPDACPDTSRRLGGWLASTDQKRRLPRAAITPPWGAPLAPTCAIERYTTHRQDILRNKTANRVTFFRQDSTLLRRRYDFLSALRLLRLNFVLAYR